MVVETVPPVIYVTGEVNSAGPQPLTGKVDVLQALATAEGADRLRQHEEHPDPPRLAADQVQLQRRGQGQRRARVSAARRHHHRPLARSRRQVMSEQDDHAGRRRRGGRIARACALGVLLWAAPAAGAEQRSGGRGRVVPAAGMELHAVDRLRRHLRQQRGAELAPRRSRPHPGRHALQHRARRRSSSSTAGASEFAADYRGFIRRYLEVEGLDGFDQRASLNARRMMTRRLTLYARDSFTDSPTTDDVELNGVPFRRTGSRTNTFARRSGIPHHQVHDASRPATTAPGWRSIAPTSS